MRAATVSIVLAGLAVAPKILAQVAPPGVSATAPAASIAGPAGTAAAIAAQQEQIAQLQRLMLSLLAYQALSSPADGGELPGFDASAYFQNGASLLTVPSGDQPGGAWFTHGAEALSTPSILADAEAPVAIPAPADAAAPEAPPDAASPSLAPPEVEVADARAEGALGDAGALLGEEDASDAQPPALLSPPVGTEPPSEPTASAPAPPEAAPAASSPRGTSSRGVWVPLALGGASLAAVILAGLLGWRARAHP